MPSRSKRRRIRRRSSALNRCAARTWQDLARLSQFREGELLRKLERYPLPVLPRDRSRRRVEHDMAPLRFDARRATARDVMTPGIHCCRDNDDLGKAVRHMEQLQVRVINKSKRMVGILSLGDVSNSAPGDLLSECVKSVSAHH